MRPSRRHPVHPLGAIAALACVAAWEPAIEPRTTPSMDGGAVGADAAIDGSSGSDACGANCAPPSEPVDLAWYRGAFRHVPLPSKAPCAAPCPTAEQDLAASIGK